MVELVVVIVIFGIIAAIGSDIYVKIYENYIVSRTMNNLQVKTELALDQIAKRLQYRIKDATIARMATSLNTIISAADPNLNDSYKILEWIGYDARGLKGFYNGTMYAPAWNGFIDVDNSNATYLSTPGSDLDNENAIVKAVSHDDANLSDAALIFIGREEDFNISKYGWSPSLNSVYAFDISEHNKTTIKITDATLPDEIYERYKLVWSAYAIAPEPLTCNEDCNITLYENYQPWQGDAFNDSGKNIRKYLLLEHVTTFKFKQDGDILHLKLCVGGKIVNKDISICKEKVVF